MARSVRLVLGLGTLLFAGACGGGREPDAVAPKRPAEDAGAAPIAPAADAGTRAAVDPSKRAPVVVAMVVDQLSAWIAQSRMPELPKDGGFAKLIREGTFATTMRYPYSVTDTAPGHASLNTAEVPAVSGVFANELPDDKGERVTILRDVDTKLVTPEGVVPRAGSSARILRVPTTADRLRAKAAKALVVSLSLKDRGAILPAGKKPSHALWYDAKTGAFVSSTAFTTAYPKWAQKLGSSAANEERRKTPWSLLDQAWVASHAATPDDAPGEGDFEGLGRTFPHLAKTPGAFRLIPASDEALVDLALAALDAEWDPKEPTLLLVSFSAHDIMSHVFGPDSWEAWDYLRRLDRTLLRLLEGVEARVGPAAFVLSADHGDSSMPEAAAARKGHCGPEDALARPCEAGRRLSSDKLRDDLRADTAKALPGGTWVAGVADPYVHLTPEARALPKEKRDLVDKVIRARLATLKEAVQEVYDVRVLAKECPKKLASAKAAPERARAGEDVLTLVCRAWSPDIGAGDYYVVPRPGSFFDADYTPGFGASHGTPWLYDRTVPLFVRARGIEAGKKVEDPVDFTAYGHLEAALLGLDATPPADVLDAVTAKKR